MCARMSPSGSSHHAASGGAQPRLDLGDVTARIEQRLAAPRWEVRFSPETIGPLAGPRDSGTRDVDAAAEVATFALGLSGKGRVARREGRVSRMIMHFALAATLALSTVASSGCGIFGDSDGEVATINVNSLPMARAAEATLTGSPREAARFTDLVLLDAGDANRPWATLLPLASTAGSVTPVLVDRDASGLERVGSVYTVPAQPIAVGSRDGSSLFLDPVGPATEQTESSFRGNASTLQREVQGRWEKDERFGAATRAIAGQPSLLDAAHNAAAAAAAGGTHTYRNGVVLRLEPESPVLHVVDRTLLEPEAAVGADDIVLVAIRSGERSLYEPGQLVNLKNVVVDQQQSDVNGQSQTFYTVNAALDGAQLEQAGKMDLQAALLRQLQRTDADLAIQAQELAAEETTVVSPQATATPQAQRQESRYRGPSLVDNMLMFWLLSNSGWFRGSSSVLTGPPPNSSRPAGDVYYTPPRTARDAPPANTAGAATSRSTVLQNARTAVSGQAAGSGGGTAATTKAAADTTARVNAATSKAATVAGQVSSSSVGRSTASVPRQASSTASRSSGAVTSSSASRSSSASGSGSSIGRGSSGFGGSSSSSSS